MKDKFFWHVQSAERIKFGKQVLSKEDIAVRYIKKHDKRSVRNGFSLIESLLTMFVFSLSIGGLLEVSAWGTMQISGRRHIDAYLTAVSWFAALEAVPVNILLNSPEDAFKAANQFLNEPAVSAISSPQASGINSGVMTVSVDITNSANRIITISRSYNIYGNDTVSDDKMK